MLINVIMKHGGRGVGMEIQTKARLLCATAFGFFCIFSISCPVPTENKTCIPHPFSILDSVYKPLHRRDLLSCVQSPGQSSYPLPCHCARLFPRHSQARVDILPGLRLLSGVEGEFRATLRPRSDFTMSADDLNNRRELHKSKSPGNFTLPPGVNWTS